jgi:hypothetical protein
LVDECHRHVAMVFVHQLLRRETGAKTIIAEELFFVRNGFPHDLFSFLMVNLYVVDS